MIKPRTLTLFIVSSTIFDFALGFFGPFWFLFLGQFNGGLEQFGSAISLMMFASAITSYVSGNLSDRMGRKTLLMGSGIGLALVILGYTLISSVWQLYILQILYGILLAIQGTNEAAMIGDLTQDDNRGAIIGRLHFFAQLAAAVAVFLAGIVGTRLGIHMVFYIASTLLMVSVAVLSRMELSKASVEVKRGQRHIKS